MRHRNLGWFSYVLLIAGATATTRPRVLLINIDGLRADFIKRYNMKNLESFAKDGLTMKLQPVFPTDTMSNMQSMVTGVLPAEHGVVADEFHDENVGWFPGDVAEAKFWDAVTPIWIKASEKKLKVFSEMWPGCETIISGFQTNHARYSERSVDSSLHLASVRIEKYDFVLMRISNLEKAVHDYGIDSEEVKETARKIDDKFKWALKKPLGDEFGSISIIITGDHGNAPVMGEPINYKNDLPTVAEMRFANLRSKLFIYGSEDKAAQLFEEYKNILSRQGDGNYLKYTMYMRGKDEGEYTNYFKNPRVPVIMALAKEGYVFEGAGNVQATHGYNPTLDSMQTILLASGPGLFGKGNHKVSSLVDTRFVHTLLLNMLQMELPEDAYGLEVAKKIENTNPTTTAAPTTIGSVVLPGSESLYTVVENTTSDSQSSSRTGTTALLVSTRVLALICFVIGL